MIHRRKACYVRSLFVIALAVPNASAEVPILTPEHLNQEASHIVVGEVKQVYSAMSKSSDWLTTKSVAAISVRRVEKGDRLEAGDVVYAKHWMQEWIGEGEPPPHASGHDGATPGRVYRVYMKRIKGDYEALLPNGIVEVKRR